jgi:DNA-binding NarL/FixJ family response regulator
MVAAAPKTGIVILTAYLTEAERSDLTRAGARAILLKEIDTGTLVRTIRTVAGQLMAGERRSGGRPGVGKRRGTP